MSIVCVLRNFMGRFYGGITLVYALYYEFK